MQKGITLSNQWNMQSIKTGSSLNRLWDLNTYTFEEKETDQLKLKKCNYIKWTILMHNESTMKVETEFQHCL